MANVKKEVKYLGRDFTQLRQNLINFAKIYFPDSYKDFNESSPGMMFIEMAAYVGDVLSYYTDQTFRESNLSTATEQANIFALAQMNGFKPKLRSVSRVIPFTEEVSCEYGSEETSANKSIF